MMLARRNDDDENKRTSIYNAGKTPRSFKRKRAKCVSKFKFFPLPLLLVCERCEERLDTKLT